MQGKDGRICKAIHQYSKGAIPDADMEILKGIAHDCMLVRNYVYRQYSGVRSLTKIYPGYTVDREMTACGLREKLNLPSVYYSRAVFDALGDIKTQWTKVKNEVYAAINENERFTSEERHYLRFVIKVGGCFENIVNGRDLSVPEAMLEKYRKVAGEAGDDEAHIRSLHNYLRRQVRKKLSKLHTDKEDTFTVKAMGYRYGEVSGNHGIFLTTREKRQRMFIPLTDRNVYDRILTIKLKPEKHSIEIIVPLFVKTRTHKDYTNEVGVSLGLWRMATTDRGNFYGEDFGRMQKELSAYILASGQTYKREKDNNPGREKQTTQKRKLERSLQTYVNAELNRLIRDEKPAVIYLPKLPRNPGMGKKGSGDTHFLKTWRKGYVEERLKWKCRENSILLIEVMGNGIGTECSRCGADGRCEGGSFRCSVCGYEGDKKENGARNAIKRGRTGRCINTEYPAGEM